ncbi:ABC transporter substrate-binding protein [Terrihabitans soli]|uniref:ABC transporter substrate-binding protein n=1 Tax=Terrihabitans soli TaxID=708113 RepID=A0A6S6QRN6_9HYPH|nr:DUF2076 family protein [Terrihabitans soli]BCJ91709.1 ABC transporter substrate-binding protein [Terrihabitans soli]
MQTRERQSIQDLFDRLRSAEGQRRDPEVERLIADELRRAPHAVYAMAQTIIAQNAALEAAGRRVEELESGQGYGEDEDEDDATPFRGRSPGAMGAPDVGRRGSVPSFGRGAPQQGALGGGGFLANAGQVALGVAGGMLLGEAAKSLLGSGSEAQAAISDTASAGGGQLAEDAGANDIGGSEQSGGEGGGLFGWLFGGGENDNGYETADGGWDDGGGDSGGE